MTAASGTFFLELTLANGAWNTGTFVYTGKIPSFSGIPPRGSATIKSIVFTTTTYTYANPCSGSTCVGANNITSALATTELFANGTPAVYTQTQTAFNPVSGKPTSSKTWDYAGTASMNPTVAPSSIPARKIVYSYIGLDTSQVNVKDQFGNLAAQTNYGYTTSATATSGVTQHGTQNAGGPYLQTVSHWLNTGGNATTTYTMDDTGMMRGIADANGNPASSITYQCANSLPYQGTNPIGQKTQYGYDCSSGAIQSVQDPNDLANARAGTTYKYESVMGRMYTQTNPDGGVTNYTYPSANEVDTATTATPDPTISSALISDAYGRPFQSITAGNEVDQSYDSNGRPYCTSNPYPQGSTTSGETCISSYDGLDRPLTQTQPDGNTLQWSYSANSTNSSNEANASWTRTVDAFSRLTSVVEPGALTTTYAYDGLGNVAKINQIGNGNGDTPRVRTFTYDSASRLICASQPEAALNACPTGATSSIPSGVQSYSYYPAGNTRTKMDARGITTTYTYDKLNRLISKQAPGVNDAYIYDTLQTGPNKNGVGRLMLASNNLNADEVFSYDPMGRVNWQASWTPSSPNNTSVITSAVYDQAGNITSLTYPDGRVVSNGFDAAGRLNGVNYASWSGTAVNQTYFSESNGYDAAGHLVNGTFGNGVPYGSGYDTRERVKTLTYGPSNAPLWSKQYAWTPNSNMQSQTDLITGVQRQFGYDNLNRLTSAQDIFSNLAVASASNDQTTSTTASGSGAEETPGATGAVPLFTNPDDSNLLLPLGTSSPNPSLNWGYASAAVAVNAAVAPDGTSTAAIVTASSGSYDTYLQGPIAAPGSYSLESVQGSVWLRSISGTQTINLYITQDIPGGYSVAGSTQVQLTTSWQQFQVTGTVANNVTNLMWQIGGGGSVTSGQGFELWNPMLEDRGISGSSVTNFAPNSQRFTNWVNTQGTVADNQVLAPDGTTTASVLTASATSTDNCVIDGLANVAPFAGQTVTASVWLRVPSGSTSVLLTLYESGASGGSALGAQTITLTTTWQRFQVSGATVSTLNSLVFQIGGAGSFTNGKVIDAWGAQVELATQAGPYVATAGVPATVDTTLTNLLPFSQNTGGTSWSLGSVSIVPNTVTAPDGSMTAAQVTGTSGDSVIADVVPNPELYDGATVTASVYLKSPSGTETLTLYPYFGTNAGTSYISPKSVTLTSTWQRFSITGTLQHGINSLVFQIGGAGSVGSGQVFDLWGLQMEVSPHAGSYVATSALPVVSGSQPTNILPSSQTLNGSNWGVNGSITSTTATAPDGSQTATIFQAPPGSTDSYMEGYVPNPSLYDGETVTGSVYLRSVSGSETISLYLVENGDQGWAVANAISVTLTPTWQRFSLTAALQNGLTQLSMQPGGGGTFKNGESFEIWGPQIVIGTDSSVYTPTSSSTTVIATGAAGTLVPNGLNQVYVYDSFGNILQNGGFNSTYNNTNRMFGFAYDAAGNQLSDGLYTALSWDAESRLASVNGTSYVYDAEGNRVEKQGTSVVDTIYFGGQPVAKLAGGQWTDLIYGPTGLLAEVPGLQGGAPMYRLTDNLGTNVGSLLANGSFIDSIDHTPFGQVASGGTNDPYFYTGLEHDSESGLDHAMFRQYASNMGRWMSPDPYAGSIDASNPQSLNRYAYVGNMPLSYTDPSGLDAGGGAAGGCFAVATGTAGPVGDAVCAIAIALDIFLLEDLFGNHHHLTAATASRPNARIWDEHGSFHAKPNSGIGDLLGLSGAGCEFGACGSNFQQGGQGDPNDFGGLVGIFFQELNPFNHILYHDMNDPNHRLFGTHYCGPGGGGSETGRVDGLCHLHDTCYTNAGISAAIQLGGGTAEQLNAMGSCNQHLCDALSALSTSYGSQEQVAQLSLPPENVSLSELLSSRRGD